MAIKEEILFSADFKKALKDMDKFTRDSNKKLTALSNTFKTLGTVAAGFVSVLSVSKVISFFEKAVAAASKEADAVNDLNTALGITGKYTDAVSKSLVNFAKALEDSSNFSSEQILKAETLIQTLGKLDEQGLKKATQGAVNLAAAFHKDLGEAATIVGKAAEGNTDALRRMGINIKATSDKAETFARVLKTLEGFAGAAEAQTRTFAGSLVKLGNKEDELLKTTGRLITDNPEVVKFLSLFGSAIELLTKNIEENKQPISVLITNFAKFGESTIPLVLKAIGIAVTTFNYFQKAIGFVQGAIVNTIDTVKLRISLLVEATSSFIKAIGNLITSVKSGDFSSLQDGFDQVKASILSMGDALTQNVGLSGTTKAIIKSTEESSAGYDALTDAIDKSAQAVKDLAKNAAKPISVAKPPNLGGGGSTGIFSGLGDAISSAFSSGGTQKSITEAFNSSVDSVNESDFGRQYREANGVAFSKSFADGAETFGSVVSSSFSLAVDAFKGTIGLLQGVLGGEFLNAFNGVIQGIGGFPEALSSGFKDLNDIVNSLLDNLPKIIEDLLKNIPAVVDNFVKKFPEIIKLLLDAMPKIVDKLVEAFPKIINTILAALPDIVDKLSTALTKIVGAIVDVLPSIIEAIPALIDRTLEELPRVLETILKGLPKIITAILQAIPKIVRSLAHALPEIVKVLAENLAPIILALVQGILEAIPEIILALIDEFIVKGGIFKIIGALIQAIPQICIAIVQGVVRAAFNSTGALIDYIGKLLGTVFSGSIKFPKFDIEAIKDFLSGKLMVDKIRENFATIKDVLTGKLFAEKVKALFDKFQEQLKTILSGGLSGGKNGGAAGALGKAGKALGFATGGIIPQGFPDDSFPAKLSSGELVIPKGDVSRLSDFLDGQQRGTTVSGGGSGGGLDLAALADLINNRPLNVSVNIGEEQFATALLNVRRRGFRV